MDASRTPCSICGNFGVAFELVQFYARGTRSKAVICDDCSQHLTEVQDAVQCPELEPGNLISAYHSRATGRLVLAKRRLGSTVHRVRPKPGHFPVEA